MLKAVCSSSEQMTGLVAVRPCLVAFWDEADLPSGVRGPVDAWAFDWLAWICATVDILICSLCFEASKWEEAATAGCLFLASNVARGVGRAAGWCVIWVEKAGDIPRGSWGLCFLGLVMTPHLPELG